MARRTGGVEVPAQGVGAVDVQNRPGIHHVSPRLGHLLAFGVQDQPQADAGQVAGLVEEKGGDGVQTVEPAPRLVHRFGDEVGGELLPEKLLVLEGVVPLGHGHGP